MKRLLASSLAVALFTTAGTVSAQTLNIISADPPSSLDPQLDSRVGDRSVGMHSWGPPVEDKWDKLQPGLALSWRTLDLKMWEPKLHPNVKRHDGQSFAADDIIFPYQRACSMPGSVATFTGYLRTVESATTKDPLAPIIRTTVPSPNLPPNLASIYIVSKRAGEKPSTEDYNTGHAVVGTGPYKSASYVSGGHAVMAHNDNYQGDKQLWGKINYRYINSTAARAANLLSGEVDVIDKVSVSDLVRLCQSPNVEVFAYPGLCVMLPQPSFRKGLDNYTTGNGGKPLPSNPLLGMCARHALSLVIDWRTIVDRILQGVITIANQWMPSDTYGCNPDVKDIAYDPTQVKELLVDTGFPQGLSLVIHVSNDRYPQGPETVQAVAQSWMRIDVRAHMEVAPWSAYSGCANKNEYAMSMLVRGNGTDEASYVLADAPAIVDTKKDSGASNWGHYSNAAVDNTLNVSTEESNVEKYTAILRHLIKLASDDAGVIPLYHYQNMWVAKKSLKMTPMASDRVATQMVIKDSK